ncbi:MAG: hypothetical protein CM1200mP2_57170 [Planctomycetaceae bacterium]|nr:MAG: hypothetical protein CM1200mP2_57170 [Planctomycetaceae bacterium]
MMPINCKESACLRRRDSMRLGQDASVLLLLSCLARRDFGGRMSRRCCRRQKSSELRCRPFYPGVGIRFDRATGALRSSRRLKMTQGTPRYSISKRCVAGSRWTWPKAVDAKWASCATHRARQASLSSAASPAPRPSFWLMAFGSTTASSLSAPISISTRLTGQVDHIEVVRGPQSVCGGRMRLGGRSTWLPAGRIVCWGCVR